jgi:hypothetical protein
MNNNSCTTDVYKYIKIAQHIPSDLPKAATKLLHSGFLAKLQIEINPKLTPEKNIQILFFIYASSIHMHIYRSMATSKDKH